LFRILKKTKITTSLPKIKELAWAKGKGKERKGNERKVTSDPKGQTFRMKGETNT